MPHIDQLIQSIRDEAARPEYQVNTVHPMQSDSGRSGVLHPRQHPRRPPRSPTRYKHGTHSNWTMSMISCSSVTM
ncbi:MAG: hypothetical protein IPH35_27230 [Rhodoferax sp.]|nr:hypothetical protein [Rhodoferax sp.]